MTASLFDGLRDDSPPGADTRNASYRQHHAEGKADTNAERLYEVYRTYGMLSDSQAGKVLGWPSSTVSARRNELLKKKRVYDVGRVYDRDTRRHVHAWAAVEGCK